MDKKEFISFVLSKGESNASVDINEKAILSSIYDKINIYLKVDNTIFCNDFYPPYIWSGVKEYCEKYYIGAFFKGFLGETERRYIAFSKEEPYYCPIDIIKVSNNSKFNILSHRDYLGALMALGIKREKIGDLIIKDNSAYFPICNELSKYVLENYITIGNCKCTVEILNDYLNIPTVSFKEYIETVTSTRLDCIVSSLCNLSRSESIELIKQGKVMVNYKVCIKRDLKVNIDSTVTIRGYGKYIINSQVGKTKSDKLKILVKKYM